MDNSQVLRDRDGDIWVRNQDGGYMWVPAHKEMNTRTLDEIRKEFGPLEVPHWVTESVVPSKAG